jgi:hypothetical protein
MPEIDETAAPSPASDDAAPKKSRAGRWILIAVLAVALLGGLGAGGYFGYQAWRRNQDRATFALAEKHAVAAEKAVEPFIEFGDDNAIRTGGDPVPAFAKISGGLEAARSEYVAALKEAGKLPASRIKTDYTAALQRGIDGIDAFAKLKSLKEFGPLSAQVEAAIAVTRRASDTQEESVSLNNAGKMDQASKKNKEALGLYTEAEGQLGALDALGRTTWITETRAWAAAQRHASQLAQNMFDEYKSRDRSSYVKAVDAYNAFLPSLENLDEPTLAFDPEIVYSTFWYPYDAANAKIDVSMAERSAASDKWKQAQAPAKSSPAK